MDSHVILCRVFGFLMISRRNKKPKQFRPEAYGLMIALMGFLRGLDPQILVWKASNQRTTNQRGSQICMCVCVCVERAQVTVGRKLFAYIDHPAKWRFVYLPACMGIRSEIRIPSTLPLLLTGWPCPERVTREEPESAPSCLLCSGSGPGSGSSGSQSSQCMCVCLLCVNARRRLGIRNGHGHGAMDGRGIGVEWRGGSILGAVAQLKWKYSQIGCAPSSDEAPPPLLKPHPP